MGTVNTASKHDERIANMVFSKVYPCYVDKIVKKGRTVDELISIIGWLTGFNEKDLRKLIDANVTFKEFFMKAKINPNAHLIKGVICGYRVEDIKNPLTQKVRYLDKLVDELARGKPLDKILRK